jgi:hypothetical protein
LLAGKVEMLTPDPEQHPFPVQRIAARRIGGDPQRPQRGDLPLGRLRPGPAPASRPLPQFHRALLLQQRTARGAQGRGESLRRTFLFSDAVTNTTCSSWPRTAPSPALHAGESFVGDEEKMHLVGKGRLAEGEGEDAPVRGKGEFWGSDSLFESMAEHAAHHTPSAPPT